MKVPKELLELYCDLERLKRNYPVLQVEFDVLKNDEPLIIKIVASKNSKQANPYFTYTYEYNIGLLTEEKLNFLKNLPDLEF